MSTLQCYSLNGLISDFVSHSTEASEENRSLSQLQLSYCPAVNPFSQQAAPALPSLSDQSGYWSDLWPTLGVDLETIPSTSLFFFLIFLHRSLATTLENPNQSHLPRSLMLSHVVTCWQRPVLEKGWSLSHPFSLLHNVRRPLPTALGARVRGDMTQQAKVRH